jgi:hypothetical protein
MVCVAAAVVVVVVDYKRSKNFFTGGTQNRVLFLLTKIHQLSRAFARHHHTSTMTAVAIVEQ